jgi:hypothetical protein
MAPSRFRRRSTFDRWFEGDSSPYTIIRFFTEPINVPRRRRPANRRRWRDLSPAYRKRLERAGITWQAYYAGATLSKARGHAKTPEHPGRPVAVERSSRLRKYRNVRVMFMVNSPAEQTLYAPQKTPPIVSGKPLGGTVFHPWSMTQALPLFEAWQVFIEQAADMGFDIPGSGPEDDDSEQMFGFQSWKRRIK